MTLETVEAVETALGRFAFARRAVRHALLAVSGGPDSLALLSALADRPHGLALSVATVDHGLRPEAAAEAVYFEAVCRDLGLRHRILVWKPPTPLGGNVMAEARAARYRLLADEAARIDADAVLVAHHADDQIETHLLARARGGAGAALAGMRTWRDLEPGVVLIRPFLELPKKALIAAVARSGLVPAADPSNADIRFRRVRLRAELADGLHDTRAIRRTIVDAKALREAEDAAIAAAIRHACDEGRLGVDRLGTAIFRPMSGDAALWPRLLTGGGGGLHPPRREAVHRLAARFETEGACVATLAGCRVEASADRFLLAREYGREGPPGVAVGAGEFTAFDRRFTISRPLPEEAARIEPLGRLGLGGGPHRTLPIALDGKGNLVAAHPALRDRFRHAPVLLVRQRVGWRIWADLTGDPPERLTAEPQNAANGRKPVGKDLAATYLRGRVKVRAP